MPCPYAHRVLKILSVLLGYNERRIGGERWLCRGEARRTVAGELYGHGLALSLGEVMPCPYTRRVLRISSGLLGYNERRIGGES